MSVRLRIVYVVCVPLTDCIGWHCGLAAALIVLPRPAGLLLSGSEDASEQDRPRPGTGRSAVLLLGRLMLAALFVFVGVNQVR